MQSSKLTIGRNVLVDVVGHANQVPAKIDTGADSSSIWASNIQILTDGTLEFTLFNEDSVLYDGKKIATKDYTVALVRSSTGHEEIRYRVRLLTQIKEKRIKVAYNLSNRSLNHFPILIGRRTLSKKFIVDVSQADIDGEMTYGKKSALLNQELTQNPQAFYEKYHGKDL